jgi:hypothetical protein
MAQNSEGFECRMPGAKIVDPFALSLESHLPFDDYGFEI